VRLLPPFYKVSDNVWVVDANYPDGHWVHVGYLNGGRRYSHRRADRIAIRATLANPGHEYRIEPTQGAESND